MKIKWRKEREPRKNEIKLNEKMKKRKCKCAERKKEKENWRRKKITRKNKNLKILPEKKKDERFLFL